MKCEEYFYNEKEAIDFMNELNKLDYESEVELITAYDEEASETVYIVYYNPKPLI